jgi:hypothetical protein
VLVVLVIGMLALSIGLATSAATVLFLRLHNRPVDDDFNESALHWAAGLVPRGMIVFYAIMGAILTCAPYYWFGPTWSYFQFIPHGGFGMGVTCLVLSISLLIAVIGRLKRLIGFILLCGGTAFYTAAWLIALQGMYGRTGLMESPFMMYAGIDMIIKSVVARR